MVLILKSLSNMGVKCQRIVRISKTASLRFCVMSSGIKDEESERNLFISMYPNIIDTLLAKSTLSEQPSVADCLKSVLDYNLNKRKLNSGLTTVISYKMLENPDKVNTETLKQACTLGWCVVMLQTYLMMLDDQIHGSKTRRGSLCWYRQPDVGLGVVNDGILIKASVFKILKIYFDKTPNYTKMVELCNEALLNTAIGQHLDYSKARPNKKDYSKFTIRDYEMMVRYKASLYKYDCPVRLALLLANITNQKIHEKAQEICLDLGILFQIQDDYIDCFGDEIGTDIEEGKCSWLAVTALDHCNTNQRIVFKSCYGSKEPAHIERIKQLYKQLNLPEKFHEVEKDRYDAIVRQAKLLPSPLPSELLIKLADLIYKRIQ